MENATKALMIAAAVLVVMLIIGLGIGVFNMASEQVDNAGDMSEYQIQQFNDKFTRYQGTSKSGSDVNAMLTTVFNHNNSQDDASTCVQVTGTAAGLPSGFGITNAPGLTTTPTKASTGARYSITCTINATTGLVTTITVGDPT